MMANSSVPMRSPYQATVDKPEDPDDSGAGASGCETSRNATPGSTTAVTRRSEVCRLLTPDALPKVQPSRSASVTVQLE